jgi:hypothetical protein
MDAAKKAQAAAEQMLAASKANMEQDSNVVSTKRQLGFVAPPDEYITGEVMDPYYDEFKQNQADIMQQNQMLAQEQAQQENQNGYMTIKKKAGPVPNGTDYEAQQSRYRGVAPDNIPEMSGSIPSGGTYGAG